MKVTNFSTLLMLLGSVSAVADIQTLDELKKEFEPLKTEYRAAWDRAAQMKVTYVKPVTEITVKECLEHSKRIEAQYVISPFEALYEKGSSHFSFCQPGGYGGHYAPDKLYFQTVDLKNQFGLPIRYVLQSRSEFLSSSLTTLYLDDNYRIVEISGLASRYQVAEKEPFEGGVDAVDSDGNYFSNVYQPTQQKTPWQIQNYSSADGQIRRAVRWLRQRRSDKGKEIVQVEYFDRATKRDWGKFDLLITHANLGGGFYKYDDKLYRDPGSYNNLSVYSIENKPVCSQGWIWQDRKLAAAFDADNPKAEHGYCGNTW